MRIKQVVHHRPAVGVAGLAGPGHIKCGNQFAKVKDFNRLVFGNVGAGCAVVAAQGHDLQAVNRFVGQARRRCRIPVLERQAFISAAVRR